VVKRRFVPDIKYEIAILHPTHGEMSQVSRDFIDLLKVHLAP
jgi:hypothetical protein